MGRKLVAKIFTQKRLKEAVTPLIFLTLDRQFYAHFKPKLENLGLKGERLNLCSICVFDTGQSKARFDFRGYIPTLY